jgi:hypothetical protein
MLAIYCQHMAKSRQLTKLQTNSPVSQAGLLIETLVSYLWNEHSINDVYDSITSRFIGGEYTCSK